MIHDCLKLLSEIWQNRPAVVVLSAVTLAVLVFVLVDTHRHRRKDKKRRQEKHRG